MHVDVFIFDTCVIGYIASCLQKYRTARYQPESSKGIESTCDI